jgi:hypothetical protein
VITDQQAASAPTDTTDRPPLTVAEASDRLTALLARFAYLASLADRDEPDDPPEAV